MSRITLNGWYQYDNTILTDIVVPNGVNKTILIETIIEHSGDLYTYYQQPDFLKRNISNWFQVNLLQFQRLYNTLIIEYNPIENYDRYEDLKETPNLTYTDTGSDSHKTEVNGTSENKVSAYDSTTYQPNEQNTSNSTGTGSNNYNNTQTETGTRTHENHIHGNVGVTTNQQMIDSEREITNFDFYYEIASRFEDRFCVQIY